MGGDEGKKAEIVLSLLGRQVKDSGLSQKQWEAFLRF